MYALAHNRPAEAVASVLTQCHSRSSMRPGGRRERQGDQRLQGIDAEWHADRKNRKNGQGALFPREYLVERTGEPLQVLCKEIGPGQLERASQSRSARADGPQSRW